MNWLNIKKLLNKILTKGLFVNENRNAIDIPYKSDDERRNIFELGNPDGNLSIGYGGYDDYYDENVGGTNLWGKSIKISSRSYGGGTTFAGGPVTFERLDDEGYDTDATFKRDVNFEYGFGGSAAQPYTLAHRTISITNLDISIRMSGSSGSSYTTDTVNIPNKKDYSARCIVGWNPSGTGSSLLAPVRLYVDQTHQKVYYCFRTITNGSHNIDATVRIFILQTRNE